LWRRRVCDFPRVALRFTLGYGLWRPVGAWGVGCALCPRVALRFTLGYGMALAEHHHTGGRAGSGSRMDKPAVAAVRASWQW
jgi:hypothetical protein